MLGTSDQHEPYSFNTAVNWEWLGRAVEDAVKRVPVHVPHLSSILVAFFPLLREQAAFDRYRDGFNARIHVQFHINAC